MIAERSLRISSISARARIVMLPRPVTNADARRSFLDKLNAVRAAAAPPANQAAGNAPAPNAAPANAPLAPDTEVHVQVQVFFGFQSVKHKLADMLTTLKGARAATYYAAMALDARAADAAVAASVAKAFTGEGIAALAGEALQAHGGIGFTWEHDLHLYLRRVKVDEMLYGTAAEHYERLVTLRV